jgi:hypothetical protein
MCPGGRKIEIFGRKHNTRPGWVAVDEFFHMLWCTDDAPQVVNARKSAGSGPDI